MQIVSCESFLMQGEETGDRVVDPPLGEIAERQPQKPLQVRAERFAGQTGQPLTVTLVWQANSIPDMNYTTFVHLVGADQQIVAQSDSVPAGGHATSEWLPGEVVLDSHTLTLPDDLVPGTYTLLVGLYDPLSGKRLPVASQARDVRGDDAVSLDQLLLP